jgi:alpha-D-xyloside xylohydrolase
MLQTDRSGYWRVVVRWVVAGLLLGGAVVASGEELLSAERFVVNGDRDAGTVTVVMRDAEGDEVCRVPFEAVRVDDVAQVGFVTQGAVWGNDAVTLRVEAVGERAVALEWTLAGDAARPLRVRWRDESDFYGGGERFNALNQKGHVVPLASRDHPGAKGLATYKPVPLFFSSAGYGFLIDSPLEGLVDLNLTQRDMVELRYTARSLRVVLLAGPTIAEGLQTYVELTGKPRVPPVWAFAPWKSRDVHRNRDEVLEDVERMRALDLPASVLVIDSPWETGYNNFELNTGQFAEPEAMFRRVEALGFYVCLWLTPFVNTRNVQDMAGIDAGPTSTFAEAAGRGLFVKGRDGDPLIMRWWKGDGALVDFTNPAAVDWWHGQLEKTQRWGVVRAFKCDDGEGNYVGDAVFHDGTDAAAMRNAYSLAYLRAMQAYVDEALDGDGVLNGRSGFAGMQRYPFCWAGDNTADFSEANGLPTAILAGQNAALSGVPLWGSDIAGYFGTPTEELFVRWTQFGALSPLMMVHMTSNLGPWDFGEEALGIYRRYAKLHMQLVPYVYAAALEARETGMPIIRPMVLACPGDGVAARFVYQYLFGPDLLVAPLEKGGTSKRVYLPKGEWVDYWTGEVFAGEQVVSVDAPLAKLPLFVRGGALIEMLPAEVDTLVPRTDAVADGVVCMDDRRVVQVWPGEGRALRTWEGLLVSRTVEGEDELLVVQADRPRAVVIQIMHRRVAPEAVHAGTAVEVVFDEAAWMTEVRLEATALPVQIAWVGGAVRWPELAEDARRVREMSAMVADPALLAEGPRQAVRVCQNLEALERYQRELVAKYAALLTGEMIGHEAFANELWRFGQRLMVFRAAAQQFAVQVPVAVERKLAGVVEIFERGERPRAGQQALAAMQQDLQHAQRQLEVLTGMLGPAHAVLQGARAAQQRALHLLGRLDGEAREAVVRANVPPGDGYAGADRAELVKNFRNVWAKNYPADEIVGVRIPAVGWERFAGWTWAGQAEGWQRYDYSEIRGQVGVALDARHVAVYEVTCLKNHPDEGLRRYRVGARGEVPLIRVYLRETWGRDGETKRRRDGGG